MTHKKDQRMEKYTQLKGIKKLNREKPICNNSQRTRWKMNPTIFSCPTFQSEANLGIDMESPCRRWSLTFQLLPIFNLSPFHSSILIHSSSIDPYFEGYCVPVSLSLGLKLIMMNGMRVLLQIPDSTLSSQCVLFNFH